MSLQQQLLELKANIKTQIPEDVFQKFEESIHALAKLEMTANAPKVGEQLKNFVLSNQLGHQRSLSELHKLGPVVIIFYRGGWCPYCNLELRTYQQFLPGLKAAGAQLVAITPELPDSSLSTIEKNELEFEVLSDLGTEYAQNIGLAFTLPEELRQIYADLGGDLEKFNGANHFDLPIPATLVVDTDGKIVFAHVDVDYTTRANPEDVLSVVNSIG
ncbi:MAG: peroxiredoxin-like family protein [Cyanobacteria bacterium P01_H01_bin.15]